MMRKALLVLAIVAAGTSMWLVHQSHVQRVIIRTHFHNAQGLKPKAKVRANGLEVGEVRDISLDPRLREQPVEVVLRIDERYASKIPDDSTATIETEGLLGASYVEIDLSKATGRPISNNAVLKGSDAVPALQFFLNALDNNSRKLEEESEKLRQTIDSQNSRTKKPAPKPVEHN